MFILVHSVMLLCRFFPLCLNLSIYPATLRCMIYLAKFALVCFFFLQSSISYQFIQSILRLLIALGNNCRIMLCTLGTEVSGVPFFSRIPIMSCFFPLHICSVIESNVESTEYFPCTEVSMMKQCASYSSLGIEMFPFSMMTTIIFFYKMWHTPLGFVRYSIIKCFILSLKLYYQCHYEQPKRIPKVTRGRQ